MTCLLYGQLRLICPTRPGATLSGVVRPLFGLTCLGLFVCAISTSHLDGAEVRFRLDESGQYIEAGPFAKLNDVDSTEDYGRHCFTVRVDGNARAILGSYRRVGRNLRFEPRFSFRPGVNYVALLSDEADIVERSGDRMFRFNLPNPDVTDKRQVVQVFPTRAELPENLLKFYIHFSGPMSRGEAYRRIRLLGQDGRPIELPFLELGEELWDPEGRRLTLLFDPGRIKRGLKPREQAGQVLRAGQEYVLEIDPGWPDARGIPLARKFTKEFEVVRADHGQPLPASWKLTIPREDTTDPLIVSLDESLDHAMLNRVIGVVGDEGDVIKGEVEVDQFETRWSFRPQRPWCASQYRLVFESTLEDLAGNSIGRPFEVESDGSDEPTQIIRELPFKVLSLRSEPAK